MITDHSITVWTISYYERSCIATGFKGVSIGMEHGLEQWNGMVECTNRKTAFNEKLCYTRHTLCLFKHV